MLAHVDVLSLHVPLLESTRDLINLANMRTMKPTAIIINTARGGVINEEDLFTALQEGVIAAAGIDAFVHEPPTKKVYGALLDIPTLTFTPHIGAAAAEIQTALCMSMCDHMAELMAGETPRDRVA
jgi:D-3-phosphoglycerate dehydrogenase